MRTRQMKTSENSPTKRTVIPNKSCTFANERTMRDRCECLLTVLPHCVTHSKWTMLLNVGRHWYRIRWRLIFDNKKGYFQIPNGSLEQMVKQRKPLIINHYQRFFLLSSTCISGQNGAIKFGHCIGTSGLQVRYTHLLCKRFETFGGVSGRGNTLWIFQQQGCASFFGGNHWFCNC